MNEGTSPCWITCLGSTLITPLASLRLRPARSMIALVQMKKLSSDTSIMSSHDGVTRNSFSPIHFPTPAYATFDMMSSAPAGSDMETGRSVTFEFMLMLCDFGYMMKLVATGVKITVPFILLVSPYAPLIG